MCIRPLSLAAAACIALAASACTPSTTVHVEGTRIELDGDGSSIALRTANGDRAVIGADGTLAIDGEPVAVTPEQAALLREYHGELTQLREAALAIAGQGVALGGKAVSEAVKGVLSGNHDDIGQRVEAEAARIESAAERIEAGAEALKRKQRELARRLPQLQPYLSRSGDAIAEAFTGGDRD